MIDKAKLMMNKDLKVGLIDFKAHIFFTLMTLIYQICNREACDNLELINMVCNNIKRLFKNNRCNKWYMKGQKRRLAVTEKQGPAF